MSSGRTTWWRREGWAELGPLSRRSRQLLLLAALTGLLTGLAVAAFDCVASGMLHHIEAWPLPAPAAAPTCGLVLAAVALRWLAHGASPETSDNYIRNVHDRHHRLDRRPVLGRVAASLATLGFGGAMGYEGPAISPVVGRRWPPWPTQRSPSPARRSVSAPATGRSRGEPIPARG
ncbi:MAG: hypothetical protein ACRDJU_09710 [Actinomycetota bacterium]